MLSNRNIERNKNGTFKRTRKIWSLENFDDGYVDANNRMRVYKPGHPRASSGGYILRSIVAYEAYHKVMVSIKDNVHHVDHNRLNDSKENLELINGAEHISRHKTKPLISCICRGCQKEFFIKQHRIDAGRGKYCGHECWFRRKK